MPESFVDDSAISQRKQMPLIPEQIPDYASIAENRNIDNNKAFLGRVLFYDNILSQNNSISCASCHKQANAFADPNRFSMGFETKLTSRNSPSIQNLSRQKIFFWDAREESLRNLMTTPIKDHIEMGVEDMSLLIAEIKKHSYYEELFDKAFGSTEISEDKVAFALEQFTLSLVSRNSDFDRYRNITNEILKGREIFNLNCANCHGGSEFDGWGNKTANIGLNTFYEDKGQEMVDRETGEQIDGWFKVPTLRNIALTAPYMHDGRFKTLEEVIEHYSTGVRSHKFLSPELREPVAGHNSWEELAQSKVKRMNLSEYEKMALIEFLNSLTDEQFISDPRLSDPFRY
jgi:cytochrome c peroxidase